MEELVQATIDIIAWFLVPFATLLVAGWLVSLFAYARGEK